MLGKAHGYQVRQELVSWSADTWANVQPGSIYHALKKMASEELLRQVETPQGKGPDRTAYELTERGEENFLRLVAELLSTVRSDASSAFGFAAAVAFLPALPRQRAIELLEYRLTQLEGQRANAAMILEKGTTWGQPMHVNELYRLWVVHGDADIAWTNGVLDRLRGGEYVMADDPGRSFGEPGN